tara:strand:+ start:178 stop:396 length:219 start_codon:yes stop_codon:yes gene_type:complete
MSDNIPTDIYLLPEFEWTKSLDHYFIHAITIGLDGSIYISDENRNLDNETNNGSTDAFISKYNSEGEKMEIF